MVQQILESVKLWSEGVIGSVGESGIALLMGLSSMNIPLPSEVILPFGGMMAGQGKLDIHLVAIAGTIGSTAGSAISYWFGATLGKPFILKYGKYVFLKQKELEHGEEWYQKYGEMFTFWGRFIPIIRSFISLPAGIFRMHFGRFLIYAAIASLAWCYLWSYIGLKLGENWEQISQYMKYADIVVAFSIAFLITRAIVKRRKKSRADA